MKEKRIVGSVYCITEIDKFGKCTNGFVPIADISVDDKTLREKLTAIEEESKVKDKKLEALKKEMEKLFKCLAAYQEATKQSFIEIINEMNRERFL